MLKDKKIMMRKKYDFFNNIIEKRIISQETLRLKDKIRNVKSTLNINCPECFTPNTPNMRSLHRYKEKCSSLKKFDIKKTNESLFRRILSINNRSRKFNLKQNLGFRKIKKSGSFVQNEIKTIAQENLFMLKRLLVLSPVYSNEKWKNEHEQNKKYKENICIFPSIDFSEFRKSNEPIIKNSIDNSRRLNGKKDDDNLLSMFNTMKSRNGVTHSMMLSKMNRKRLDESFYRDARKGPYLKEHFYKTVKKENKVNKIVYNLYKEKEDNKNIESNEEFSKIDEESGSGSGRGSGACSRRSNTLSRSGMIVKEK